MRALTLLLPLLLLLLSACADGDDTADTAEPTLVPVPTDVDVDVDVTVQEADPTPTATTAPPTPTPLPEDEVVVLDEDVDTTPEDDEAIDAVLLNGAGIETPDGVITFGTEAEQAIAGLSEALGAPTSDTGYLATGDGSGCPGTEYRFVDWGDLSITILDESEFDSGPSHLASALTFGEIDATAFVGDRTLVPLIVEFTTVADLREAFPADGLVIEDAELGPFFSVEDNLGQLSGALDTVDDDGTVQSVIAGDGCGE